MQYEDIQRKLRKAPFHPFRMFLTDGASFDVRHPEMVLLGRRSLVLGLNTDPDQTVYDRAVDIDLLHVFRVEELEVAAKKYGAT